MFAEERKIKELQQQIDDLQKIVDSKYDSAHRFYVYKFVNNDWGLPFYVGKGYGKRKDCLDRRSDHIQAIWNHFNCESLIVKSNMTEIEAVKYEQELKRKLKSIGMPIIDGEAHDIRVEAIREGKRKAKLENPNYKEGRPFKFTDCEISEALKLLETMTYRDVERITKISKSTLIRAKRRLRKPQED